MVSVYLAGTFTITATATDSRGYTSTVSIQKNVTSCEAPVFTSATIYRTNDRNIKVENDEGGWAYISATFRVNIDAKNNTTVVAEIVETQTTG